MIIIMSEIKAGEMDGSIGKVLRKHEDLSSDFQDVVMVSVTSVLETGMRQREEGVWDSLVGQSHLISGLVEDPILEKHSDKGR